MKVCVASKDLPVLEDVGDGGASFRVSPCSCMSGWLSWTTLKTCYSGWKKAQIGHNRLPLLVLMSVRPAQLILTHTDGFK